MPPRMPPARPPAPPPPAPPFFPLPGPPPPRLPNRAVRCEANELAQPFPARSPLAFAQASAAAAAAGSSFSLTVLVVVVSVPMNLPVTGSRAGMTRWLTVSVVLIVAPLFGSPTVFTRSVVVMLLLPGAPTTLTLSVVVVFCGSPTVETRWLALDCALPVLLPSTSEMTLPWVRLAGPVVPPPPGEEMILPRSPCCAACVAEGAPVTGCGENRALSAPRTLPCGLDRRRDMASLLIWLSSWANCCRARDKLEESKTAESFTSCLTPSKRLTRASAASMSRLNWSVRIAREASTAPASKAIYATSLKSAAWLPGSPPAPASSLPGRSLPPRRPPS